MPNADGPKGPSRRPTDTGPINVWAELSAPPGNGPLRPHTARPPSGRQLHLRVTPRHLGLRPAELPPLGHRGVIQTANWLHRRLKQVIRLILTLKLIASRMSIQMRSRQIGRASCRERV